MGCGQVHRPLKSVMIVILATGTSNSGKKKLENCDSFGGRLGQVIMTLCEDAAWFSTPIQICTDENPSEKYNTKYFLARCTQ